MARTVPRTPSPDTWATWSYAAPLGPWTPGQGAWSDHEPPCLSRVCSKDEDCGWYWLVMLAKGKNYPKARIGAVVSNTRLFIYNWSYDILIESRIKLCDNTTETTNNRAVSMNSKILFVLYITLFLFETIRCKETLEKFTCVCSKISHFLQIKI